MIIDGIAQAKELKNKVKSEILKYKKNSKLLPKLSVILVGDYLPSQIYVKNKEKAAAEVGVNSEIIRYSSDIEESKILSKIDQLNFDNKVSGILVQLPLPSHIDKKKNN